MPKYIISLAAQQDLLLIAQYGDEHFGLTRSDQYREKLKARFTLLADTPLLFPEVYQIRSGYRRSVCGVHSIYYRIDDDNGIEIMRVLGRQDTQHALLN